LKKTFIALPFAALLLAGCSSPAPTVATANETQAAAVQATTAAPADRSAKLGETVTYDKGVKVTLQSLGFQPVGQYASGAIEGQAAVFELTVENGGDTELSAGLMSLAKVSYGEKNTKAESVIDSGNKLGLDSFSTILPGETQTVKFGAAIPAASAGIVRIEVTGPNAFADKPAIFKGAV
jgi:hypothetical protein